MEITDTSKNGLSKFAFDLVKKYGLRIVTDLIAELVKHAWNKDPKEDDGVVTNTTGPGPGGNPPPPIPFP